MRNAERFVQRFAAGSVSAAVGLWALAGWAGPAWAQHDHHTPSTTVPAPPQESPSGTPSQPASGPAGQAPVWADPSQQKPEHLHPGSGRGPQVQDDEDPLGPYRFYRGDFSKLPAEDQAAFEEHLAEHDPKLAGIFKHGQNMIERVGAGYPPEQAQKLREETLNATADHVHARMMELDIQGNRNIPKDQKQFLQPKITEEDRRAMPKFPSTDGAQRVHGYTMNALHEHRHEEKADPGTVRHGREYADRFRRVPELQEYAADRFLKANNPNQALKYADRTVELDPNRAEGYSLRASAKYQLRDYPGAYADARRALELDPNDARASTIMKFAGQQIGASSASSRSGPRSLGSVNLARPQGSAWPDSASDVGRAAAGGRMLSLDSSRRLFASEEHAKRADALFGLKDYRKALEEATKATQADPSNARAWAQRAAVHNALKDYEAAVRDAAQALQLDPNSVAALINRSFAYRKMGRFSSAYQDAHRAIQLAPRDPNAYFYRGLARLGMGDSRGFLEDLEVAASLDGRFREMYEKAAQTAEEDLPYLFPDEKFAEAVRAPSGQREGDLRRGLGRLLRLTVLSAAGGLLVALALVSIFFPGVRRAATSVWSRARPVLDSDEAGVGRTVGGQFEILSRIGEGGMGIVFEACDHSLDRKVAIKKMRDEFRANSRERERFLREARTVANLRHPNIVEIFSILEEGPDIYLIFEFVEGKTLHDEIRRKGRLPVGTALAVAEGAAKALAYAHTRGVIHRDLKPSNVMLGAEPAGVKVMDFGIAREAKDAMSRLTRTDTIAGTPPYMAPELEQGIVTKEADLYALGVCIYEMLTGKSPFRGEGAGLLLNKMKGAFVPISQIVPRLPVEMDAFLAKALAPDPAARFRTADSLMEAFRSAVNHRPVV